MSKKTAPASTPGFRHLYLVDGSGFIFRAFHALPPLTRPDGTPVGAVLGFCNMLMKLLDGTDCDGIAVIFDAGRKTFRNDLYGEYKAQRPEPPPELIPQFALVRRATEAFNVKAIEMENYEADDLIATYARLARDAGAEVTIVSSDKDLMQLVRPGVGMLDPIKNRPIGPAEVREKFGVDPDKVVEVQALAGDSVDNVPGVPGIGVKTAAQLITEYGDLETLLQRAGEIKQPKRRESLLANAEKARISRSLVLLKDDVPDAPALQTLARQKMDRDRLLEFLSENQFRSLIQRLQNGQGKAAPPPGAEAKTAGDRAAESATVAKAQSRVPATANGANAPIDRSRYTLVQDLPSLMRWILQAEAAGYVAVDTETTSLDAIRAELVGVSLALKPNEACYIPLGHGGGGKPGEFDLAGGGERPKQIPLAEALAALKPLLADPAVLKIGHNLKYDIEIFARHGLTVAPIDDTMLISYVLEGGIHGHGMDELSSLHLGHQTIKFTDVAGSGKEQITFDRVALDKARDYAAEDADVTLRLHQVLKPRLVAEHLVSVYETIERPLAAVVAEMERAGVLVDRTELARLSKDFAGRLAELETQIHKLAGEPFNIGSPKQLGDILFGKMGLKGGIKTKTGAYSTNSDILEPLAAEGHDIAQRVLDWRELAKLKSTYTDALVEQINPDTGRVHTSFALAATNTGRLSSTDPNLQNIPIRTEEGRKIRRAFVARKGYKLLSVDYSQIELRLVAEMAAIDALRQAFREGVDIHALTASQVFGVPIKGMDPMVRRKAKAINFGIIYGISGYGLGQQIGVTPGEANAYIKAYLDRYAGIREYMERMKAECHKRGYVETLFGRRCHIQGANDRNMARRSFAERQAINAPIQGTAADIIKRAMIRVAPAIKAAGLDAAMLLQVHDELLFEVRADQAEKLSALVREIMEGAAAPTLHLSVPLVAEAGIGGSWAEAH
ncbi:MAG: DNA polymerase I [Alphaproteobacteria bacterium]|nr:DNA polymerase I [Alphaproteobacteria bacterium]